VSVRGKLLIAAPSLFDYFRRTVVLVLEHTPEGAMGVVLGRETETRVADVVPQLADLPGADDRVYLGGPVSPESVVALGDFDEPEEAGLQIVGSLGTLDPDCANQSLRRLRVFAGYAGWAPGQLDDELEEDAWIVQAAEPADPSLD
jgi:putative transcriptional regulator